ncbi:MAG: hypothetical protein MI824_26345 [Hyphomicrobiales bacterium]|nr:hypothetical protein [Hyphomicrobiales bacterium]
MTVNSASASYSHIPDKPHGYGARPFAAILAWVTRFMQDYVRARYAAHLYDSLSLLSDADLERRGITREELPKYVFDQAFGDKPAA